MKKVGYARVSSKDQNLDRQIVELVKYVSEDMIFTDKQSGKDFNRENYQALRKLLSKGDEIYIKSLDRLGRNKMMIKEELAYFKSKGIIVRILDLPTTMIPLVEGQEWIMEMINNLLLEVLSTIAEQERLNTKKRQMEGIACAKAKGKKLGRPTVVIPSNFKDIYSMWREEKQITAVKAMQMLGMKKATFYNVVKAYERAM